MPEKSLEAIAKIVFNKSKRIFARKHSDLDILRGIIVMCLVRYLLRYFEMSSSTSYATARTRKFFSIDDKHRQWATIQIKGKDTYTSTKR